MAYCQADAVYPVKLRSVEQIVRRCTVAGKTWVTFFSISCTKRLWDVVGNFLGSHGVWLRPPENGASGAEPDKHHACLA
jgi:hypothetical protein